MTLVIGYGNLIDSATLSGTWTNTANLKTRYLAQKALAGAGAYLNIDLGSATAIGLVALVADTLSGGTVTITAGATVGAATFSTGALAVYSGQDFAHTFTPQTYRYWRITVSAAGSVGRVFIGPRFRPGYGAGFGSTAQIESLTKVSETLGGMTFFDQRPNRRVWQGKLEWLTDAEGYAWQQIQRDQDVWGEAYLIEDDTDTTYRGLRNFYGRLRNLSAIEWPYATTRATALEIAELL